MKMIANTIMGIVFLAGISVSAQQAQPQQPQQQSQEQQQVSDQEIKKFASAFQEVQMVQQKAQQKMVTAVEKEGLDVQRFNELQQAQQDPAKQAEIEAAEMKKFQAASETLGQIQTQAQEKMTSKIIEQGLTVNRFQEISAMMQSSPEIQQKVQELLQG